MYKNSKSLFIIIPVHNRKHFTRNCLLTLRKQTIQDFTTVVVDDGSSDGTIEMIQEEYPDVIVLRGDGNLWWSGAMNKGVKYALDCGAKYILSLNNDTELPPDFVEQMINNSQEKPKALMGAFALEIDTKRPDFGGTRMNWAGKDHKLLDILTPEQRKGLHWVTHLPGRGLWIPYEVFEKVGLFDEVSFPQAGADYDFTLRASRAGYKIYCNFDATLYSHVYASSDWEYRLNFSLKNYLRHLMGFKGGGNLKVFIKFTMRHCPPRYRLQQIIKGTITRLGGYPWRWLKHILKLRGTCDKLPNLSERS